MHIIKIKWFLIIFLIRVDLTKTAIFEFNYYLCNRISYRIKSQLKRARAPIRLKAFRIYIYMYMVIMIHFNYYYYKIYIPISE